MLYALVYSSKSLSSDAPLLCVEIIVMFFST